MIKSRAPFTAAAWLAALVAITFAASACQAPRQTDSFRATSKSDPNAHEATIQPSATDAEPTRKSQQFQAQPKKPKSEEKRQAGPFAAAESVSPAMLGDLEFHFIKVGQGDATLLKLPNGRTILVDGGSLKERNPKALKDYLDAEVTDGSLDTLVITHPDADHYNALPYAVSGLTVGQVLMVGTSSEYDADANVTSASTMASNGFKSWLDSLPSAKRKRMQTSDIDAQGDPSNALFDSGEVNIWIVAADVKDGTDKNTRSICLLVSYGDFDCLLLGDATFKTEESIVAKYDAWWLDVECLKLGHHGSKWTSTSPAWVNVTSPEIAISSASLAAMHGHPSAEIRARLEAKTDSAAAHKIKWWTNKDTGSIVSNYTEAIYSTATNGTIVISTDGAGFDVDYSNN